MIYCTITHIRRISSKFPKGRPRRNIQEFCDSHLPNCIFFPLVPFRFIWKSARINENKSVPRKMKTSKSALFYFRFLVCVCFFFVCQICRISVNTEREYIFWILFILLPAHIILSMETKNYNNATPVGLNRSS